jgi:hypothetical protein
VSLEWLALCRLHAAARLGSHAPKSDAVGALCWIMQDVAGTAFAEVKRCPCPEGIAASGPLPKAGDLDLA